VTEPAIQQANGKHMGDARAAGRDREIQNNRLKHDQARTWGFNVRRANGEGAQCHRRGRGKARVRTGKWAATMPAHERSKGERRCKRHGRANERESGRREKVQNREAARNNGGRWGHEQTFARAKPGKQGRGGGQVGAKSKHGDHLTGAGTMYAEGAGEGRPR